MAAITYDDVQKYYNDDYYRDVSSGRPAKHYDLYLKYIRHNAKKVSQGQRLLDAGCGTGRLISRAIRGGYNAAGIDISERAVQHARELCPGADLRVGRVEELPWPAAVFDAITCLGSLEHMLDMSRALLELRRVAKADATFVFMVPNREYEFGAGTEQKNLKETLLNKSEWEAVLRAHGFGISALYPDQWPMQWTPVLRRNPFRVLQALHRRLRIKLLPMDRCYQFIFLCTKVGDVLNSLQSKEASRSDPQHVGKQNKGGVRFRVAPLDGAADALLFNDPLLRASFSGYSSRISGGWVGMT